MEKRGTERRKTLTAHDLLHRLWTKAVGTPDYDKSEWIQLETLLLKTDRRKGTERRKEVNEQHEMEAYSDKWLSAADIRFKAVQPLSGSTVRKHLKDLVEFGFAVRKAENRVWLYLKLRPDRSPTEAR